MFCGDEMHCFRPLCSLILSQYTMSGHDPVFTDVAPASLQECHGAGFFVEQMDLKHVASGACSQVCGRYSYEECFARTVLLGRARWVDA